MNQSFNIKILFFTILFFSVNTFSQNINLERMDNEEIEKIIDSLYYSNPDEGIKIVKFYIKKSKKEKSNESLYIAYRYASKFYPVPINFKYTDSALIASKRTENKTLITDAYLNKGVILMDESLYQKALDNILIANKYSLELNDNYIINKTTYFIAQNKIYLGLHEDANKELVNCYNYFKVNLNKKVLNEDYKTYYIFSLMSLIDSNTRIGKHQENISLLEEAYDFIYKNNFEHLKPYFISSEGTEAFYNKNYNLAIRKLSEAIRLYNDQWPHLNDIFYIGLSNWKLGKRDVAVKYFEEIDKEYDKSKKLNPEF